MSSRVCVLFLLAACALAQVPPTRGDQPANLVIPMPIFTVSHAATGSNRISPGSQVRVFASLFPSVDLSAPNVRIEMQLKDSPIAFTAERLEDTASQSEIRVVFPHDLPLGEVHVYLAIDGQRMRSTIVQAVAASPGIYTEFDGFGPALAHQYDEAGASLNGLTHPATPGQLVTLWATGLGASPQQAIVELAGRAITPEFSGRNPVIPGLDQINFRIPSDHTPLGCYIPVAIRIGEVVSEPAALSIGGNAGACPHPLPLNYSELSALDRGDAIPMALFTVTGVSPDPLDRREDIGLSFLHADKRTTFVFGGLQLGDAQYYSCPVPDRETSAGFTSFYPDAGPPPVFAGPDGRQILLTASDYSRLLRPPDGPFSAPGQWLLSVSGGADIAAFQQSFRVPPPVRGVEIQHSNNTTTITWDPSGFVSGDVMKVTHYPDLVCRAPAWAGQVTIPGIFTTQGPLTLEIEPHPATRPRFRVPRTDGTSMPGIGAYLYRESLRRE